MVRSVILFLIAARIAAQSSLDRYDLSAPSKRWILPRQLHEISGIASSDSSTVACVQDENGIVFFYDLARKYIRRELAFGYDGDYEGICLVNRTIYVLRSDGVVYEINDFHKAEPVTRSYETLVPALNNEGLCYDAPHNRLLIGCKGRLQKGPGFADSRMVYAFDLATKRLDPEPVFEFSIRKMSAYAIAKGIIPPTRTLKNGREVASRIHLNTSEIALHPISGELYVISAVDHVVVAVDLRGEVRGMVRLDPVLFNKPEGIAFLSNGDMLVTNEGQGGVPTLLRFRYRGPR